MITAGVDCGAKNTKVVLLKDGEIVAKSIVLSGFDQRAAAEQSFAAALEMAGMSKSDVSNITATGAGMKEAQYAQDTVTEVGADAKGANFLFPSAKTIIDVGAEEGRAIKSDGKGKVIDFAVNEKCAAGAGSFTEAMARALEIRLEEMGPLSLKSQKAVPMNAQCAVFAESEVVTLIHAKTAKEDIARAVHDAIADRISSMVRRVGIEKDVALIGGVARNVGFVKSLEDNLEISFSIPEEPEYVSALGAAIVAAEHAKNK
ncbi:MAG: CoA activase [Gemmatimonadota bacterium]|nr:MAG: CoA activase [Gemmatimonadota bacterium]